MSQATKAEDLGKFKYLKRIQHRLSSVSATPSQQETSRSNSSYRLESDKSSFIDVFNCRKPIGKSESFQQPTAKKNYEPEPEGRHYNPQKYFSEEIETAISRMLSEHELGQETKRQPSIVVTAPLKQYIEAASIFQPPAFNPNPNHQTKPVQRPLQPDLEEQQPDIAPFPSDDPADRRQCQSCFRNFNPDSFAKHERICQKVFFKKRNTFDSAKQRFSKPTKS